MIPYLLILTIAHAWFDARRIKTGKHIYHGWGVLGFALLATALIVWYPSFWIAVIATTTRAAFFDIALNLFRGKNWLYNGAGGSLIDRIENKLGISMFWMRIACIGLYLITTGIYLIWF